MGAVCRVVFCGSVVGVMCGMVGVVRGGVVLS